VINRYAGGNPISRTAAIVAPGAIVMALIYAWGPLSGLHINPGVTLAFTGRRVFRASWALPYIVAQLAGAILAALFLQLMFSHIAAGGNYPINKPGGEWRSFVMEIVLTAILVRPSERGPARSLPARQPRPVDHHCRSVRVGPALDASLCSRVMGRLQPTSSRRATRQCSQCRRWGVLRSSGLGELGSADDAHR
jgi:Major intrinsic protein